MKYTNMTVNSTTTTTQPIIETTVVTPTASVAPTVPTQNAAVPQSIMRKNFLSDDGHVNLDALSEKQIEKCKQITKNLSSTSIGSVQNFGIEVQSKLSTSSKNFITTAKTSRSGEVGKILGDLTAELDKININDLKPENSLIRVLQKIPLVNKFVPNIQKTLRKYETIEESIAAIEDNIKASRINAIKDNNQLQVMFDDQVQYIRNVEDLLVAGTLALEDAKVEFNNLVQSGADAITVSDQQAFIESLDKRLTDLNQARTIAKNGLMQIRLIQRNNISLCDSANAMINLTVPIMRNQMSLAVSISRQNDSIEVQKAVRNKTNELLKANSEALYKNTVETARAASESVVDADVIRESAEKVRLTIEEIKKVQMEAQAKRAEENKKLAEIENSINNIMTSAANYQVDTAAKGISLLDE